MCVREKQVAVRSVIPLAGRSQWFHQDLIKQIYNLSELLLLNYEKFIICVHCHGTKYVYKPRCEEDLH